MVESDAEFMSRLDRDSQYRCVALQSAVERGGQDGGLEGGFDVLSMAETYYNWLQGDTNLKEGPILEKMKNP